MIYNLFNWKIVPLNIQRVRMPIFTSINFIFIKKYDFKVFISLITIVIIMKYINYLENKHT